MDKNTVINLAVAYKELLKGHFEFEKMYIFGSYAKGNFSAGSDIDLLLIGNHDIDEAARKINVLEKRWGREINVIDLSRQEFDKRKKNKDFLLLDIFNNKTIKIIIKTFLFRKKCFFCFCFLCLLTNYTPRAYL